MTHVGTSRAVLTSLHAQVEHGAPVKTTRTGARRG